MVDLHLTCNEKEYPGTWTAMLRYKIRKRDNYTCQICNKPFDALNTDVHHINYNKNDCSELNLITLCEFCHDRTNKNRHVWYDLLWHKVRFDST